MKRLQEGHAEAAGTELYLDLSSLSLSTLGYYRMPRRRWSRATTTASTPPGERQYLGKPPGNDSTWGRQHSRSCGLTYQAGLSTGPGFLPPGSGVPTIYRVRYPGVGFRLRLPHPIVSSSSIRPGIIFISVAIISQSLVFAKIMWRPKIPRLLGQDCSLIYFGASSFGWAGISPARNFGQQIFYGFLEILLH